MVKKYRLLVATAALGVSLLTMAGCSNGGQSSTKSSDNTEKATAVYYQNLSKSDKKNVKFEFKLSQDETKDNSADPVYMVSMKVKNNSNKTIKFHEDKFIYVLPEDKTLSKNDGTLTVKPDQTKNIDQLFDDIPEQGTLGDGVIEYLNSSNKLAYAKFENNIATSDNLKDKQLSKNNESTTGNSTDNSTSKTSASSSSAATTQSSSSATAASSSSAGMTEAQARQTLLNWSNSTGGEDFGGYSIDELTVTHGDSAWGFTTPDGISWTVYNDGSIHAPGDPIQ